MLGEPVRAHYSSYGAYALAAIGYAYIVEGGRGPGFDTRVDRFLCSGSSGVALDCSGSVAGVLASGTDRGDGTGHSVAGDHCCDCGGGVAARNSDCIGGGVGSSIPVGNDSCSVEREGLRGDGINVVTRGKNYRKNKNKKEAKRRNRRAIGSANWIKDRERRCSVRVDAEHDSGISMGEGFFSSAVESGDSLKASLERKWKAQNELAVAKAERDLELLRSVDVSEEVRKRKTALMSDIETNMVRTEKAHRSLQASGNVPGCTGFAETVVSGDGIQGESISPYSSASMAEFRAQQKALIDAEAEIVELKRKLDKVSNGLGKDCNYVDFFDKRTWTDNSENREILAGVYPDGYGELTEGRDDGKFQVIG